MSTDGCDLSGVGLGMSSSWILALDGGQGHPSVYVWAFSMEYHHGLRHHLAKMMSDINTCLPTGGVPVHSCSEVAGVINLDQCVVKKWGLSFANSSNIQTQGGMGRRGSRPHRCAQRHVEVSLNVVGRNLPNV